MSAASGRTCKAALFSSPRCDLQHVDLPLPVPGPHEALVRIQCCTICGSDLHTVQGRRREATPAILGHEVVGIVEEVGSPPPTDMERQVLNSGDRVTWSVAVSCFQCDRCRAGLPQKCRQLMKYGHSKAEGREALSGGLAEFMLLKKGSAIVKLDPSLADEVVCPANCATATVAACYRQVGDLAGKRILILGAGMLGLTAAAYARQHNAQQITVLDTNESRLALVTSFGADHGLIWEPEVSRMKQAFEGACGSDSFDVILELSGAADAVTMAPQLADFGAQIVLAGSVLPTSTVPLDPEWVVRRCLSICGVHNYAPVDLQVAVRFLAESYHAFPFGKLVDRTFALAEVNAAIRYAMEQRPVRIAVRP